MATYNAAIVKTSDFSNVAFLEDLSVLTYEANINGYAQFSCNIRNRSDLKAVESKLYRRSIKVYRNGDLVFFGPLVEPLTMKPHVVSLLAKDPFYNLAYRRFQSDHIFKDMDQGEMLKKLLGFQNDRHTTWLTVGDTIDETGSVTESGDWVTGIERDRSFWTGQRADESFLAMTRYPTNAPFFRVKPIDGDPDFMGQLDLLYPNTPRDRTDVVRFEFGEGTLDNCIDYEREQGLIRTAVTMYGANVKNKTTGKCHRIKSYQECDDLDTYGLWEDQISETNITSQSTLDDRAEDELVCTPCTVTTMTGGPDSPKYWDDFDLNDKIQNRIIDGFLAVTDDIRVGKVTVTLNDESGGEYVAPQGDTD